MNDHKAALAAAARKGAREAARAYKDQNPEAAGLRVKADAIAFKPRSKEVRDIGVRAVGLFLSEPNTLQLSNADLVKRLSSMAGDKVPLNILTERYKPRQIAEVQELLNLRRIELDLKLYNTPSKVKGALKGTKRAEASNQQYTAVVTFSDDTVTVGNKAYPIQRGGGTPRIHVGSRKINVDALKALLTENT